MKERPILFNAEMVRAILDGRKTQTRRMVKPQPIPFGEDSPFTHATLKEHVGKPWMPVGGVFQDAWQKPFGTVGDRLWVRETWRVDGVNRAIALKGEASYRDEGVYRADLIGDRMIDDAPWIPSIHMPRWASRIDLEITAVRVERVQDISENDAFREGIVLSNKAEQTYYGQFSRLWQSIYGFDSWRRDYVWVYEFGRVKP